MSSTRFALIIGGICLLVIFIIPGCNEFLRGLTH